MGELDYPIGEWRESYEQAEIAQWDTFSGDLHDWPLAQFLCGTVENMDVAKKEPLVMQGVINMLESEGFDGFSPEFFVTVLKTANGQTKDDFQELAAEWMDENMAPCEEDRPDPELFNGPEDWELWYRRTAMRSTEVYGAIDAGGTLFWFDRGTTW